MVYRERYEVDPYEERYQNIVLRQQSRFGRWFVVSLGAIVVLFVVYLIYSNVFLSPATRLSPERSLRVLTQPTGLSSPPLPAFAGEDLLKFGTSVTIVPHSRATNALMGGHGPAAVSGVATTAPHGNPEIIAD